YEKFFAIPIPGIDCDRAPHERENVGHFLFELVDRGVLRHQLPVHAVDVITVAVLRRVNRDPIIAVLDLRHQQALSGGEAGGGDEGEAQKQTFHGVSPFFQLYASQEAIQSLLPGWAVKKLPGSVSLFACATPISPSACCSP